MSSHTLIKPTFALLTLILPAVLCHAELTPQSRSELKPEREKAGLYGDALKKPFRLFCKRKFEKSLHLLNESGISDNRFIDPSRVALLKGMNYFALRVFTKAHDELSTSRRYRKSNSDTLYLLGVSLFQLGQKEAALQLMDEALWFSRHQVVPPEVILERKALIQNNLGNPKEAAQYFNRSAQSNPQYVPARLGLARYHLSRGDLPAALAQIRIALPLVTAKEETGVVGEEDPTETTLDHRDTKKDFSCSVHEVAEILISSRHDQAEVELLSLEIILSSPKRLLLKEDIQSALELSEKRLNQIDQLSADQKRRVHNAYIKALILSEKVELAQRKLADAKLIFSADPQFKPLADQLDLEIQSFLQPKEPQDKSEEVEPLSES